MHDDTHGPHPNDNPEFAQAWAEANPEIPDDPPKTDVEVLDWILFSPDSLEHQDIRDRVFRRAWDLRECADKDAAVFLDNVMDAIRGDDPGKLESVRKDAEKLKPTLGRLQAVQGKKAEREK